MTTRLAFAPWCARCTPVRLKQAARRFTCGVDGTDDSVEDGLPRLTVRSFAPRAKRERRPRSWVAQDGSLPPTRIAVVGGGLAGLAVTWHLLHSTQRMAKKRDLDYTQIRVTTFDPAPPGTSGATAAAAGLLHPFTPRVKKKCWHAKKGIPAAEHLIEQAQAHANSPLLVRPGILRLALDDKARDDYESAARRYPNEIEFWDVGEVAKRWPNAPPAPAAFLTKGAVVHVANYARALAAACEASGRVEWRRTAVADVRPLLGIHPRDAVADAPTGLGEYDAVVVANGAAVRALSGLVDVPVTACRGQNVRYTASSDKSVAPPFPVISGKYIVPDLFRADGAPPAIIGGATFEYCGEGEIERDFVSLNSGSPDISYARGELTESLTKLLPSLPHFWHPDNAVAGTRSLPPRSTLGSVPLAGRLQGVPEGKSLWILNGLGSRGLLHHAYLGKLVAQAVVAGNEKLIPIDARRVTMSLDSLR